MKLADRLNYILAPIILGVFLALSFITYFTFKEQTINSLTSQLAYDIDLINQSINQEIYSSDTLLRQHLDSKEALAFFNTQNQSFAKASYEAQLISRFVKMKANADFIDTIGIFNLQKEPDIYINLNDPFASAKVSIKALEILQKIEQAISTKSRIRFPALQASLIKNANNQYQLQVIRLFSPHLLSSEKVYIANKSLRLIQLVNSTSSFVKHQSKLAEKYQNNTIISYKPNENFLNAANNKAKTTFNNKGDIVVTLNNKVTEINITLKSEFIDHELMNIIKVISFVLAVVSFISYFSLSWLINKQVIKPITKLAGDIENIDISENTQLTYLTEKDEISELTNRYFSLVNRVNQLAHKDPLTGLLNRTSFNHALKKALLSSHHSSKLGF